MTLEKYVGPSHKFTESAPRRFNLPGLSGMVVEFSGWNQSACISLSIPLIQECQLAGKICAWIVPCSVERASLFFPPDFAESGINCSEIPILWCKNAMDGFGIAEKLLRSGGFGMLVLDLTESRRIRSNTMGRIHNMAQRFGSLVLCLTRKPQGEPSLDPMIFVHVHVEARKKNTDVYEVMATIQKDKAQAPGKTMSWVYDAPPGLC